MMSESDNAGSNDAAVPTGPTIARLNDNPPPAGSRNTNPPNANNNPPSFDPWGAAPLIINQGGGGGAGAGAGNFNDAQAMWRERERRQRSIRVLMMFLLMLLLMDGEEQQKQRQRRDYGGGLRKGKRRGKNGDLESLLDPPLYEARRVQDEMIAERLQQHPRYLKLLAKNEGKNVDLQVRRWADQQQELQKDEFAPPETDTTATANSNSSPGSDQQTPEDPEAVATAWHYPWNVTGFYRGDWAMEKMSGTEAVSSVEPQQGNDEQTDKQPERKSSSSSSPSSSTPLKMLKPVDAEFSMLEVLHQKQDPMLGVHLLPPGMELLLTNMTSTSVNETSAATATSRRTNEYQSPFLRGTTPINSVHTIAAAKTKDETDQDSKLTLTKTSGRAAFQLFSRTVPAMKEVSIVDGFVKLYDSNTVGYSTRRDLLLRVHGVLIHSLGRMSLVANTQSPGRAALVLGKNDESVTGNEAHEDRRRLQELLQLNGPSSSSDETVQAIRDEALRLFYSNVEDVEPGSFRTITSFGDPKEDLALEMESLLVQPDTSFERSRRLTESAETAGSDGTEPIISAQNATTIGNKTQPYEYSKYVVPFPFVWDDDDQSLQRYKMPNSARTMPAREQQLEANAGSCEFELDMNIQEEKWTVGQWRKLVDKHMKQTALLDPLKQNDIENDGKKEEESSNKGRGRQKKRKNSGQAGAKPDLEQALVMTINGTIMSSSCDFVANVNATAIRTDWEFTTSKAINYSFYMMLTCLTQIVLLLRQLLHTQAQSAATRVSLMCIGWQTVVDALLCLVHIYLSLAMQPLFTAFASVAFFKLLIFCVIEMKYMAIIIQARNASNGGNTIELLRRQIAMLHLRFYVALMTSCLGFFYSGETYRTAYMLLLYSFWVPQIIQNIVTEAKRPLHPYYVYGMSLSRLVAPLYIFAFQNNFLKEVYPESPTNVFMCELLILWVGIQAGILEAQGRYGARFMIPARFLPPKFDYNRPIPPSLLPPGSQVASPTEELKSERSSPATEVRKLVVPKRDTSPFAAGTRNRMKGSRLHRGESGMTAETVTAAPKNPSMPKFDCVICYNDIDVNNRTGYMLAPCDHLFHKDCLVQWMEVKMECK
ncbi:MAG: hypothetical protein SGILL_005273 [Bacillariaceae sp.]